MDRSRDRKLDEDDVALFWLGAERARQDVVAGRTSLVNRLAETETWWPQYRAGYLGYFEAVGLRGAQ